MPCKATYGPQLWLMEVMWNNCLDYKGARSTEISLRCLTMHYIRLRLHCIARCRHTELELLLRIKLDFDYSVLVIVCLLVLTCFVFSLCKFVPFFVVCFFALCLVASLSRFLFVRFFFARFRIEQFHVIFKYLSNFIDTYIIIFRVTEF